MLQILRNQKSKARSIYCEAGPTRPQMEEFENGLFVSVKMMQFNEVLHQVSIDNLSIVMMNNLLITFLEEKCNQFNPVKERLKKHTRRFWTLGTDYLAFAMLDVVIDIISLFWTCLAKKLRHWRPKWCSATTGGFLNQSICSSTKSVIWDVISDLPGR